MRAGFVAVLAVFITVTLLAFGALQRAETSNESLVRTEQVLVSIEAVVARSVEAETGTRGFLLTGDPQFLAPFDEAERTLPRQLDFSPRSPPTTRTNSSGSSCCARRSRARSNSSGSSGWTTSTTARSGRKGPSRSES